MFMSANEARKTVDEMYESASKEEFLKVKNAIQEAIGNENYSTEVRVKSKYMHQISDELKGLGLDIRLEE